MAGHRRAVVAVVLLLCLLRWRKRRDLALGLALLGFGSHGRDKARRPEIGSVAGTLSELCVFPMKSGRAIKVGHGMVTKQGMSMDRKVMLINDSNTPITQRMIPELAKIVVDEVNLLRNKLLISCEGCMPLELDLRIENRTESAFTIDLHQLKCKVIAFDDSVNTWFNDALTKVSGKPKQGYRLVVIAKHESRNAHWTPLRALLGGTQPWDECLLADLAPLTLVSEDSLAALNEQICGCCKRGQAADCKCVPVDRFRSNMVIKWKDPSLAFIEDHVEAFRIGSVTFRVISPTFRCVIPSIDQDTGAAGFRKNIKIAEPVATLKALRPGGLRYGLTGLLPYTSGGSGSLAPLFGCYVGVDSENSRGDLRLGDPVVILKYKQPPGVAVQLLYLLGSYFGLAHPA